MIIRPSIPHGHLVLALRLFEPDFIEVSATHNPAIQSDLRNEIVLAQDV
jgi:hypothetical protein